MLLLDEAAQVWELLTTHARRTAKGRGLTRAKVLLGEGLLTSEGETHRRHRRALQPAFGAGSVAAYEAHFVRAARRTADHWSDGGDVDLVAEMSAMTLDGAGSGPVRRRPAGAGAADHPSPDDSAQGFPTGHGSRRDLCCSGPRCRPPSGCARPRSSSRGWWPTWFAAVGRDESSPGPVLDLLAAQTDLTDEQARAEVMTLLLAGHETTAMALTWAWAAIDQAPAVRADLEAEWDADRDASSVGGPANRRPLTMAVLAETLRLWPPSWMFSRRVLQPLPLGGRTVPVGTMCLVSPLLLHRDPRWWTEPERFRPDRWLSGEPGGTSRFDPKHPGQPRGAYLPFGAGPRMCIGEQFAWSEAATMLAELGRSWRIRAPWHPSAWPIVDDLAAGGIGTGDDVAALSSDAGGVAV